jgi:hypothetical protein
MVDRTGSTLKVETGGALVPGLDQARARASTKRYSARKA